MPIRDWRIRIQDILESIRRIESYVSNMSYDDFEKDEKTIDAVIRNLEIIGEAARFIPEEIELKYPDIPWLEMWGIRNVIAHEYFGVSLPIIWKTAITNLSPLKKKFKRILN